MTDDDGEEGKARPSDPQTSHDAAKLSKHRNARWRELMYVELSVGGPGAYRELAERAGLSFGGDDPMQGWTPRGAELREPRKMVFALRKENRINGKKNETPQTIWCAVYWAIIAERCLANGLPAEERTLVESWLNNTTRLPRRETALLYRIHEKHKAWRE